MSTMIPKRAVIDTNVCLDLFVFRDARYVRILNALRNGDLHAVTNAECRKEWLFVLSYPHLPLDSEKKMAAIAEYDSVTSLLAQEALIEPIPLPVCKDAEDQKFMKLAHSAQAATLLTKDKALLKLAKRTAKLGLFTIVTPEAWLHAQGG